MCFVLLITLYAPAQVDLLVTQFMNSLQDIDSKLTDNIKYLTQVRLAGILLEISQFLFRNKLFCNILQILCSGRKWLIKQPQAINWFSLVDLHRILQF